jgi:hypothetical protein
VITFPEQETEGLRNVGGFVNNCVNSSRADSRVSCLKSLRRFGDTLSLHAQEKLSLSLSREAECLRNVGGFVNNCVNSSRADSRVSCLKKPRRFGDTLSLHAQGK